MTNTSMTDMEWKIRVDLAACYRLVALYGMSDLIHTHISARLPASLYGDADQFLINPYGMLFDEITASSLVRINSEGRPLSPTPHEVNRAGFVIHSAIHEARPDVHCVLHIHSRAGTAVSAQRDGLLPISQQASLVLGSLAYHDYEGIAVHDEERPRLQRDFGGATHFMLRNHGLLVAAFSTAAAFWHMYIFETACQIQIAAQSGGSPLIEVSRPILDGVDQAASKVAEHPPSELAWPALLRRLDRVNPGYAE